MNKSKLWGFVLAGTLLLSLTACSGDPMEQLTKNLESGDYGKVVEVYQKRISGNVKKEHEAAGALKDYLATKYTAFVSDEITEEDFEISLEMLDRIDGELNIVTEDLNQAKENYATVQDSRKRYEAGVQAMAEQDYTIAMDLFAEVQEADSLHYEEAQSKWLEAQEGYLSQFVDEALVKAQEGSFDEALRVLDQAEEELGSRDRLEEVRAELTEKYAGQFLTRAQEYVTNQQYDEAMSLLDEGKELLGENTSFDELRQTAASAKLEAEIAVYVGEAESRLSAGEYEEALDVLEAAADDLGEQEKLTQKNAEICEQFAQHVLKQAEEFTAAGQYDEAVAVLEEAEEYLGADARLESSKQNARTTQLSADVAAAVSQAQASADAGDFAAALDTLAAARETLGEQEALQQKDTELRERYAQSAAERANAAIAGLQYDEAITTLEQAVGRLGEREDLTGILANAYTLRFEAGVNAMMDAGDAAGVIAARKAAEENPRCNVSAEMGEKIANYINTYRQNVIAQAEAAYNENGYEAALGVINGGLNVLPGDEELAGKKAGYEQLAPVYLTTLDPFMGELDLQSERTDNMGNSYINCYKAGAYEKSATYDIGGVYKALSAKVAVSKFDGWNPDGAEAQLRISGDGRVLYENMYIGVGTKPFSINVDITGVTDLTIYMKGEGFTYTLQILLADVMLLREPNVLGPAPEYTKSPKKEINTGAGGYIIPDSDSRYLEKSDLQGLSAAELRLARNEIYARHGRRFDDQYLQSYFDGCDWYQGTISPKDFDESVLNKYEKKNAKTIKSME